MLGGVVGLRVEEKSEEFKSGSWHDESFSEKQATGAPPEDIVILGSLLYHNDMVLASTILESSL